jgi:hypothetical protein
MVRRLGLLAATIGRWARRRLTRQAWLVDRRAHSDAPVGTTCPDRPESSGLAPPLAEDGGFSLARRVWGETPVRGEYGWMQAPIADVHPDLAGTAS